MLGDLEPEWIDLVIVPLEAVEEAGTSEIAAEELPTNIGGRGG